ncbi:MAG: D-alanyl-D-alanine carboxypeptidase [Clostridia bacterium]|nr:D-alanyl-D-alanine carboxypeptidase [Clostridia bacterium]
MAQVDLNLPCKSAILIEQTTGEVLYSENPDEKLPIASVTKIMTLLLTMEALEKGTIKMDDNVPISENAASMGGSQVFLEPGEEISVHDVLKAVFVSSANDGAVALAEMISGSVEAFVAAMNDKAAALGMHNTIFCNPTGLDDGETGLSTARDVALMSKKLLSYKETYSYTTIWIDSIRNGAFGLSNTNKLVRFYPGATGLKTGSTAKAKYCVSASAERNGLKLCAVVLAGESSADRFSSAKTMLDWGFANYAYFQPEKAELSHIRVWGGTKDSTSVSAPSEGILVKKTDAVGIQTVIDQRENLDAPVEKGQRVGTIFYQKDGKTIYACPITADEEIPEISFGTLLTRLFRLFFTGKIEKSL